VSQITRHCAPQNDPLEPVIDQQTPHARHRAQQGMSVRHAHGNPWDSPPAPVDSNDYVPHH